MAARKKKEARQEVSELVPGAGFSTSDLDYVSLDDAIETLQRIRDDYTGKKLQVRHEYEPYSDYKRFNIYEKRLETDAEMASRQAKEAQHRLAQEDRERAELERLQKKFGPR